MPGVKHANVPVPHGTHCPLLQTELGGQQTPLQHTSVGSQHWRSPVRGEMHGRVPTGHGAVHCPWKQMSPGGQQTCRPSVPQQGPLQQIGPVDVAQTFVPGGHALTHSPLMHASPGAQQRAPQQNVPGSQQNFSPFGFVHGA